MLCKCSVFKHVFCYWGWKKKCCFSHRFLFFTECMLTRQAKSPLFSVILLCFCSLCHMVFLSWGSKWFQMFEKHQVQCNRNFFQTQTPLRFVCDFPVFMLFFSHHTVPVNELQPVFFKYLDTICVFAPGFLSVHKDKTGPTQLQCSLNGG